MHICTCAICIHVLRVDSFWLEFQSRVATGGVTSRSSFHSCSDGEGNTHVELEVILGVAKMGGICDQQTS